MHARGAARALAFGKAAGRGQWLASRGRWGRLHCRAAGVCVNALAVWRGREGKGGEDVREERPHRHGGTDRPTGLAGARVVGDGVKPEAGARRAGIRAAAADGRGRRARTMAARGVSPCLARAVWVTADADTG